MNHRKFILIVFIIMFISLFAGLTYSYLRRSSSQNGTNVVTTLNCLDVSISDTEEGITGLSLTGKYPVPDSEGLAGDPYKFTITNNCTSPVSVNINLDTLSTSTIDKQYVKYDLSGDASSSNLVSAGTTAISTLEGVSSSNKLASTTLSANQAKNFELRLWIDENTTTAQAAGKSYYSKVEIEATALVVRPFIEMFNLASADTASTLTTPGVDVATADEGLRTTPDDYGTSYYYRGAVTNNFVIFANMCWRIVRIDGAGNIKLVLYNYNPRNAQNPCATSEDGTSNAFARYTDTYSNSGSGANGTSTFSINSSTFNKNAYVGFMYGTAGSDNYDDEHANENKSGILKNLEVWYDEVFTASDKDKLADVIWCNDKSLNTDSEFTPAGASAGYTNLGYNAEKTYYGAITRLIADKATSWTKATTEKVSLVCPSAGTDGKLSKFTVSDTVNGNARLDKKIGLLTADEIAFAGAAYSSGNTSYYLYKNTSNNTYWLTLSPSIFNGSYAYVLYVHTAGYLYYGSSVSSSLGLRPAVSLKSTASVTTASATNMGTASNPYLVQ